MAALKLVVILSMSMAVLAATPAQLVKVQPATLSSGFGEMPLRYDWNRTGVAMATSNINTPHVRWTFMTNGTVAGGPITADINKDGKMEIFLGEGRADTASRKVYSLDYRGNLLWVKPVKWDVAAIGVADLNHYGRAEVIFSEMAHQPEGGLHLYVMEADDGSMVWSFTDYGVWEEGFSVGPIIYDVNNDGVDDITLGSMDAYAYTFSGSDGAILWQSPRFEHYIRASSPFYDINGDGEKDFVVWDNHGVTRVYSVKNHVLLWEKNLGYGTAMTPLIADLDGDKRPDIVFDSVLAPSGLQVLRADGSVMWANTAYLMVYHSPTIAYVDGDNLPDVVIGDSGRHAITAFRGFDGTLLWETVLPAAWSQGPLVNADVDGDGVREILVGSDSGLHVLNSLTGAIEWTYSVFKVRNEPKVVDIDGDGKAEILFGAGDGKMYVLDKAPPPRFDPRTIGYWKHQCKISEPGKAHVGISQAFIDAIRSQSRVFSSLMTKEEACSILLGDYKSDMAGRAKQQLLALWLNVVSGFVDLTAPINLPKLTSATTVGGAILDAENLILTRTDKPSLERAKNICDSLNNGIR